MKSSILGLLGRKGLVVASTIILLVGLWLILSVLAGTKREKLQEHALLTARVWLMSADLREDPNVYRDARDSLLSAHGTTSEKMMELTEKYESSPEDLKLWTELVKQHVDSLLREPRTDTSKINTPSNPRLHSDSAQPGR